ncbi:hypothetical protein HTZ84_11065 [Haloterrigena sp. SYSU A558-1]|uniref:Uncharacterized protein n=2 Tax=Haloterrigena gelatinilytica TaxID=2741724 RepID=A0A8J8GN42_9EURY|nr:hypothetical protein [Haloterrigena gelatinilytica]NUC72843.1 hypothetical protein [Haloterrigena gelatinilytica]
MTAVEPTAAERRRLESTANGDADAARTGLRPNRDEISTRSMPLPPEPMLLYVIVTSVVYGLLWRWWWTTVENGGVELSYSEDRLLDAENANGRRDDDAEVRFRDE